MYTQYNDEAAFRAYQSIMFRFLPYLWTTTSKQVTYASAPRIYPSNAWLQSLQRPNLQNNIQGTTHTRRALLVSLCVQATRISSKSSIDPRLHQAMIYFCSPRYRDDAWSLSYVPHSMDFLADFRRNIYPPTPHLQVIRLRR